MPTAWRCRASKEKKPTTVLPVEWIDNGVNIWDQISIKSLIVTASLFMAPIFRERLDKQFLLGTRNQAFLTEYLAGMATA